MQASPVFILWLAFSIIHFHVRVFTERKPKNENGGGLGMRLIITEVLGRLFLVGILYQLKIKTICISPVYIYNLDWLQIGHTAALNKFETDLKLV